MKTVHVKLTDAVAQWLHDQIAALPDGRAIQVRGAIRDALVEANKPPTTVPASPDPIEPESAPDDAVGIGGADAPVEAG